MKTEILQFYIYIIPLSWTNRKVEREREKIAAFKRINEKSKV